MQITRGKIESAQKCVLYGPEGIGKSYFASRFPNPVFIDTEGSTKHMDVARLPVPSSWTMLLEEVKYVKTNPHVCDTLVIDTADWAEKLCIDYICANKLPPKNKEVISGIEDFGYGKGYVYLMEEFGRLLNALTELIDLGINVVIVAHAQMRKFEQPDELGSYDRWEMKLQKKTAPIVKEWADMVLFANYKTFVVNVDGQGIDKGVNKARGGKRVMYTTHHPCWDAKNRHDLLPELELHYDEIAHCIPPRGVSVSEIVKQPTPEPVLETTTENTIIDLNDSLLNKILPKENKPDPEPEPKPKQVVNNLPDSIPRALADLMQANKVTVQEIQQVVADRGYYPADMPIDKYDPDFIKGCLVGAWEQMFKLIKDNREIPF